jgi:hypothetical protein
MVVGAGFIVHSPSGGRGKATPLPHCIGAKSARCADPTKRQRHVRPVYRGRVGTACQPSLPFRLFDAAMYRVGLALRANLACLSLGSMQLGQHAVLTLPEANGADPTTRQAAKPPPYPLSPRALMGRAHKKAPGGPGALSLSKRAAYLASASVLRLRRRMAARAKARPARLMP